MKLLMLFGVLLLAGCAHIPAATPEKQASRWQPTPGLSWQWQLKGAINTSYNVDVYDIDLFDTPIETIQQLHARGIKVICYFSAGTYEDWRPDADNFPDNILGKPLADWPDERWLDISEIDALTPIMSARLDIALKKGCNAVEPDNVDGYDNDTGKTFTSGDQLRYNLWLSEEAHKRGMAIGLKNDLDQVVELVDDFDFAVNEQCFEYDECEKLLPFIRQNKAVLGVEYNLDPKNFCGKSKEMRFSWLKMDAELGGGRVGCE